MKVSYLLRAPLLALKLEGGEHPNLRNLSAGTMVTLASEVRESGLVDVTDREDIYAVFYADLYERGEMVAGAPVDITSTV